MNIPGNILSTLTDEQKKKVEAAQSPEELLALAKETGYEMSQEQLDAVSGGNVGWEDPSVIATTTKDAVLFVCRILPAVFDAQNTEPTRDSCPVHRYTVTFTVITIDSILPARTSPTWIGTALCAARSASDWSS